MEEKITLADAIDKLSKQFFRCMDSDMLTDAIDYLDKIIELDPSNASAWAIKGNVISQLAVNTRQGGIRMATEVERTTDDQKRLLKESLKCCEKAIDINPKSDLAFQYQALTLARLGRKDQALESNNIAIELNPNNFGAGIQGTSWLINLRRFEETYEVCKRLKQSSGIGMMSDAEKLTFFSNFATALVGLKRYEEALAEINRAIDVDDKNALTWVKKGEILFGLHRTGYLECFDNAVTLEPDNELFKKIKSQYSSGTASPTH